MRCAPESKTPYRLPHRRKEFLAPYNIPAPSAVYPSRWTPLPLSIA